MVIVTYAMIVSSYYCYICYDSKVLVIVTYASLVSSGYCYICYDSK